MSKPKTIPVPVHLCMLLTAEPDDFKDPEKYTTVHAAARAMLRILLDVHAEPGEQPVKKTRRRRGLPVEQPALKDPAGN